MHELSLCQALVEAVERIARREHAVAVESVTVSVGVLSGAEPDLLAHAFEIARAGTVADGARLRIERLSARVACRACGRESEVATNDLLCPACGEAQVEVVSGDELRLDRVELLRAEAPPAATLNG